MSKKSLNNSGQFTVGKNGSTYLPCQVDFLRFSLGTLKDAETDIEALYKWEFDGPFLKDFFGRTAVGKCRDIGAVEYIE